MTPSEPVRWGIVGTGFIANQFVEDLALLPDATVSAVCSRRLGTAATFAQTHGISCAYGDLTELARDPDVDVVYVATPHAFHYPATKQLLEAGKPVLCEKPLTLDHVTARELVDLARARGVFLMEAMWTLINPTIQRCHALARSGAIGDLTHVAADFGVTGPFPAGHRLRDPRLGGGALLDLGVYPVALAQHFLGRPDSVIAWASRLPEGTDENTALILGYANGATATLHAGMSGETAQRAVITGTTGRIEIDHRFWRTEGCTVVYADGRTERIEQPVRGHGMVYEAEEVMRCLRAGLVESPILAHQATLSVMATLDTALRQVGVSYPPVSPARW